LKIGVQNTQKAMTSQSETLFVQDGNKQGMMTATIHTNVVVHVVDTTSETVKFEQKLILCILKSK
jgi:hypothetical protein